MSTFILLYNLYPAPTCMYLQPACYVLAFVCTQYRRLPHTEHSPVTSVLFEPHWPYHIQTPHHPLRTLWSTGCLCLFKTLSSADVCWAEGFHQIQLPPLDLISQLLHCFLCLDTIWYIPSHHSSFYQECLRTHGLSRLCLIITCQWNYFKYSFDKAAS